MEILATQIYAFLPALLPLFTRKMTARVWTAIYMCFILTVMRYQKPEFSVSWVLNSSLMLISFTSLLAMTILLTPLPRPWLRHILRSTIRDSGDMGIQESKIVQAKAKAEIDIVAVNGLGAHPDWTWSAPDPLEKPEPGVKGKFVSWLSELLPEDIPNARIIPSRQNSSWLVDAPVISIEDCAKELLDSLAVVRKKLPVHDKERPIIFIAHSFGGIVVKQAMAIAAREDSSAEMKAIFKDTSGIIFLGTPHYGTWPSSIGSVIAKFTFWIGGSSRLLDALGYQSSTLQALNEQFAKVFVKKTYCFSETKKTYMLNTFPIMLVNSASASLYTSQNTNIELGTDHSGLNKFAKRDENYNKLIRNLKDLVIQSTDCRYDDEINKCLETLKVDSKAQEDLRKAVKLPVTGTCDWTKSVVDTFLENRYSEKQSSKALLFCGGPGAGKSVISKFVAEYLESRKDYQLHYVVFKDTSVSTSLPLPAIKLLVHNILSQNRNLYRHLRKRFKKISWSKYKWTLEDLLDVLGSILDDPGSASIMIVMDAPNECQDAVPSEKTSSKDNGPTNPRKEFMEQFGSRCGNIANHFIITTQRFDELLIGLPKRKFIDLDNRKEIHSSVEEVIRVKVDEYIDRVLAGLLAPKYGESDSSDDEQPYKKRDNTSPLNSDIRRSYEDLRLQLKGKLAEKAGNMVLWVSLFMKNLEILPSTSPQHIIQEVDSLPRGIIELYIDLFTRRSVEYDAGIRQKLPWILFAQRPLKESELRDALTMQNCYPKRREDKRTRMEGWRVANLEEELGRNFGSLVVVDRSSDSVQLFHSSLRGALLGKSIPPSEELRKICRSHTEEHAEIAVTCIEYLCYNYPGYDQIKGMNLAGSVTISLSDKFPFLKNIMDKYPFLEYAALNWADHVQAAGETHPEVQKAFERFTSTVNAKNLEMAYQIFVRTFDLVLPTKLDLPEKLAIWGLEELAIKSIELGNSFDQPNDVGTQTYHAAAFKGLLKLMEALEKKGVAPDVRDSREQTAVHYAAQGGRLDIIKYPTEKGLGLDETGTDPRWTALHYAANGAYFEIIDFLLQENVDALKVDIWGYTALQHLNNVRAGVAEETLSQKLKEASEKLRAYESGQRVQRQPFYDEDTSDASSDSGIGTGSDSDEENVTSEDDGDTSDLDESVS